MTWEDRAAILVRSARQKRGLTQSALAIVADVPQPTISLIEAGRRQPSLPLLARLLEAASGPVDLEVRPNHRHSARSTADRVAAALAGSGEDTALRAVLDMRDALRAADGDLLTELTQDPPALTGDRRFDAFIAGVAEEAFHERRSGPPGWTQEPARFVRPFWYLSGLPDLHWWEFSRAPGSLLRHGVIAARDELESV